MAALAIPLLEAAAFRVLTTLGVGLAAGAAGEAARKRERKRQEASDRAASTTVSRSEAKTQEPEKCKECPPDRGKPFQRNFPVRKDWVDYQARITGFTNGPTFIMEWEFNGVKFDGFVSDQCLLQEAKAGYDQFFDEWGRPERWWAHNIEEMMVDIRRQGFAAIPRPPVRLEWYWQQAASHRYFSRVLRPIAPDIPHQYLP